MTKDEIEIYINTLIEDENNFKNKSGSSSKKTEKLGKKNLDLQQTTNNLILFSRSLIDFLSIFIRVKFNKKSINNKKIVYTSKNFCNKVNGEYLDRIVKPLFTENIIFINQSKEYVLDKVNNQKVYNLGGLVKFLSIFKRGSSTSLKFLFAYTTINDLIIKNFNKQDIYILCFYHLNSLSLIFSKYRHRINLIEVQHGSIINYPPYSKPALIKIVDIFYVKNENTIEYLKTHLCKNFQPEYRLMPYPKVYRSFTTGLNILYASTIEINGIHPVFKNFLSQNNNKTNLNLIIRLHPREREKESLFSEQLNEYKVNYKFDHSENWLEGNKIENLIVVSPWSSTIEDSYDNNFLTIIIDPVGRERFQYLIDNKKCYYSEDLSQTLSKIKLS